MSYGRYLNNIDPCGLEHYELVFEDNFSGNTLDLTKWDVATGVPRDHDFNLQKAWHSPNNIDVSNGTLKITAEKLATPLTGTFVTDYSTNPPTTKTSNFDFTTAEITSKFKFFYGKYEIRCRLPGGKGFWPAFWTFGGPGWNEIDIFEIYGDNFHRVTNNVHHDYDNDGDSESCRDGKNNAGNFANYHIFTCIFDFDRIVWQIDGQTIRTLPRFQTVSGSTISCHDHDDIAQGTYFDSQFFPRKYMNIIANLAIQSGSSAPDQNTPFPSTYEIDYIRFYKRDGCCGDLNIQNTSQLNLSSDKKIRNFICGEKVEVGGSTVLGNDDNLTINASKDIILHPGFVIQSGSSFETRLVPPSDCCPINVASFTNVFTPNGDGINDQLCIKVSEATSYRIDVYDRWGNHVYGNSGVAVDGLNCIWNGAGVCNSCVYTVAVKVENSCYSESKAYPITTFKSGNLYVSDNNNEISNKLFHSKNNVQFRAKDLNDPLIKNLHNFEPTFNVFPNPNNGKFTVSLLTFSKETPYIMVILNQFGQTVHSQEIDDNQVEVNLDFLSNGVYSVIIKNKFSFSSKSIIIN